MAAFLEEPKLESGPKRIMLEKDNSLIPIFHKFLYSNFFVKEQFLIEVKFSFDFGDAIQSHGKNNNIIKQDRRAGVRESPQCTLTAPVLYLKIFT